MLRRMKQRQIALGFLVIVWVGVGSAQAQTAREIAKKVSPSVVVLVMSGENGRPISLGSGFVVKEGVIATNVHVIAGARKGYAKLPDQKEKFEVEGTVGIDRVHDLVLLSVKKFKGPALVLGKSSDAAPGDDVYAVGNPEGLEGTFSKGMVSGVRKTGEDSVLQITAPISPGSSGGPVLDAKGNVIGVAVATIKDGQNLNFAIPVSYLAALMKDIKDVSPLSEVRKGPSPRPVRTSHDNPGAHRDPAASPLDRILPEDVERTELVGSDGAFPYAHIHPRREPVIGFQYKLGGARDQASEMIELAPVYQEPDGGRNVVVAKKGYVVGGLIVDASDKVVTAVRVIFVRFKDGRPDAADSYKSDWIGEPGGAQVVLDAGDKIVCGTCGIGPFTVVSVSLVLTPPLANGAKAPKDPPSPVDAKLPEGVERTELAGGPGAFPFVSVRPHHEPVIGFGYKLGGNRDQKSVLLELAPLTQEGDGRNKSVVAKKGYIVGGLVVDAKDDVNAFRVIFVRFKDGRSDPTDSYKSDWIGEPTGVQTTLDGQGKTVVGICGIKTFSFVSLGLVLAPPADNPKK